MLKEFDKHVFNIYQLKKKKNPKFTNILGTGQVEENEKPAKEQGANAQERGSQDPSR